MFVFWFLIKSLIPLRDGPFSCLSAYLVSLFVEQLTPNESILNHSRRLTDFKCKSHIYTLSCCIQLLFYVFSMIIIHRVCILTFFQRADFSVEEKLSNKMPRSIILFVFFAQTTLANLFYLESEERCVREMCPREDYFRYLFGLAPFL